MLETFPSGIDVAAELKVTDEQTAKLQTALARIRQELNALNSLSNGRRGPDASQILKRTQSQAEICERGKKDIAGILTPEQMTRAEQIELQERLRFSGMRRGLETNAAFQKLGISPEQFAKLKAAEQEAEEQYRKETAALHDQQRERLAVARKKVLGVLTPEQQAEFEKLIGTPLRDNEYLLDTGVAGTMGRDRSTLQNGLRGFGGTSFGGTFGRGSTGNLFPRAAPRPANPNPETKP
jgi:hypothetical protein